MNDKLIERAEWLADKIMGNDYILEAADVLRKMAKELRSAQSGGAPAVVAEPVALIPWVGNKTRYVGPVPDDALVDIKFRNGEAYYRCLAGNYSWRDTGSEDDIIAYRPSPIEAIAAPPAPQQVVNDARDERIQELTTTLEEVQRVLAQTNNTQDGPIVDTIWRGPAETLFDYIDAALQSTPQGATK